MPEPASRPELSRRRLLAGAAAIPAAAAIAAASRPGTAAASPVHDTGLDATGLAGADGFLVQDRTPPFAPGTGSPFVRLPKGTPVNV